MGYGFYIPKNMTFSYWPSGRFVRIFLDGKIICQKLVTSKLETWVTNYVDRMDSQEEKAMNNDPNTDGPRDA